MRALQARNFIVIFILAALLAAGNSFAQNTVDDLGKAVFQVFKNKDLAALDTLIPSAQDMIDLYKEYPNIKLPDRFEEKYGHHMELFKKKCRAIMEDTTLLRINWPVASLQKVELEERKIQADTLAKKKLPIPYLNVFFNCDQKKYCLQFKNIHQIKGQWKLDESVRIRNLDDKRRE